jgi:WD40 repeat protein
VRFGAFGMGLVLVLVGGSASPAAREPEPSAPHDAVLYSIGISTNPYGRSRPNGFGVLTGIASGEFARVERRGREYGGFPGAEWLDHGWILVQRHAPPLGPAAIFMYRRGKLERVGTAPFPGGSAYWWSPDWKRVAYEPPAPCRPHQRSLFSCYRASGRIIVTGLGQVARGNLGGWTPDGRLVVYATPQANARGNATLLDLRTWKEVARRRYWPGEQPIRSADGRYLATRRGAKQRTEIIVSRAGRVVQTLTTHYILSMFAWSTRGHLLAYTTSGFPSPHQLFVVDPGHDPRKIFATGRRHFDWITWSPDGRRLLLDGDSAGGWRVFSARTGKQLQRLPRRASALVLSGQRIPRERRLT